MSFEEKSILVRKCGGVKQLAASIWTLKSLKNTTLVVTSILVCLLIAEGILRLYLPSPPVWKYPQAYYQFDSEIGHRLKSNQTSFTHNKLVVTNSQGQRVNDHRPVLKTPNVILALGDSQTFGNGLSYQQTWPMSLEKIQNNISIQKWAVINAGLSGTDTWQHEILLPKLLTSYKPKLVILALYTNDIVPKHIPRREAAESISNTWFKRITYKLKNSVLLLTLREAYHAVQKQPKEELTGGAILSGNDNDVSRRGWVQTEKSLKNMAETCRHSNIKFMMVILPRRDQVSGKNPYTSYNKRLIAIANKYKIPYIDILPSLKVSYKTHGNDLFIPWDGHNSEITNRVIAEKVAIKLRTMKTRRPAERK